MGKEYIRTVDVRSLANVPGRIIIFDNFGIGKAFVSNYTGADGRVEITQSLRYNSQATCRIKTRVTSPAADDQASLTYYANITPQKQLQLDLDFYLESLENARSFEFWLTYLDGTYIHYAKIRFDSQNSKWQYLNSAGTWTDIAGSTQLLIISGWHHATMVVDFFNDKYVSLSSENASYDLSSFAVQVDDGPAAQYLILQILLYSHSTTPPIAYIANVVLSVP